MCWYVEVLTRNTNCLLTGLTFCPKPPFSTICERQLKTTALSSSASQLSSSLSSQVTLFFDIFYSFYFFLFYFLHQANLLRHLEAAAPSKLLQYHHHHHHHLHHHLHHLLHHHLLHSHLLHSFTSTTALEKRDFDNPRISFSFPPTNTRLGIESWH